MHRFPFANVLGRSCGLMALCLCLVGREAPADTRVISLAPNLTELVYALGFGQHLVGRSSACDYPTGALDVTVVGGFGRPNWEALINLQPDWVIATDLEKPGLMKQLERHGIRALTLPCESWAELIEAAQQIASALGAPERADAWIATMTSRKEALRDQTRAFWADRDPLTLYAEVWGQPIMTPGRRSFLHEVILWTGADSLSTRLPTRYQSVSTEWLVEQNPDVILLAYMVSDYAVADRLRQRLGWSRIRALQTNQIIDDIDPDWLLRPGPRLIKGAEALAERLRAIALGDEVE